MVKEYPTLYAALVGRAARSISQRLAATDATLVGHGRTLGFTRRADADASTICSAIATFPRTRSTACRRCARWRIFRSRESPLREFPELIEALAAVKEAAALANAELGLLDKQHGDLDRARGAGDARRPPSRAFRRRHDPGRRGHVDEHERERGHRQSRARAARQGPRRLHAASTRTTTSTSVSRRTTCIRRP